jgi:hypothetical protein
VTTPLVPAFDHNHYCLLRTVEAAWGLAPLTTDDAQATVMSDFFTSS